MVTDIYVAIIGVWGLVLLVAGVRSVRRPRTSLRDSLRSALVIVLGCYFTALSLAHFDGYYRQTSVNLSDVIFQLSVLAVAGFVVFRGRRRPRPGDRPRPGQGHGRCGRSSGVDRYGVGRGEEVLDQRGR